MDLKSRLSRLQAQAGTGVSGAPPIVAASSLRSRLAQLRPERVLAQAPAGNAPMPVEALAGVLGGELLGDSVIVIRQTIPLCGVPGDFGLPARYAGECSGASADPQMPCAPPPLPGETTDGRRLVYIDTETTGLSGGSGTLAFLLGSAVVEDEAIALTQWLMARFSGEATALDAFADTLTPADHLVSYNGKSYDLPLLVSRFRMQGLAHPFAGLPHLDLLHPVRRLFARRWDDCRLQTLEKNLLGFTRVDDLPGSEAPEAWFRFLRSGHGDALVQVVEHNRQDILSLAAAHHTLARTIARPRACDMDLHALARWLAESDENAARTLLQAHAGSLCDDGRRLLGRLLRRAGDWRRAVAVWEVLAAAGCSDSMERLAKYHEHVSKDLAAARRFCAQLPDAAEREHRRRRLDRKLGANMKT